MVVEVTVVALALTCTVAVCVLSWAFVSVCSVVRSVGPALLSQVGRTRDRHPEQDLESRLREMVGQPQTPLYGMGPYSEDVGVSAESG